MSMHGLWWDELHIFEMMSGVASATGSRAKHVLGVELRNNCAHVPHTASAAHIA